MGLNTLTTTRFPGGITNRPENDVLGGSFKAPDPTLYHQFFEDFDYYVAANWTVTETQEGATQALADEDGGVLLITNTAADDDMVSMQKAGESFTLEQGKRLFFKARLAVSDAEESDILCGLIITDASPFDATDGVFFRKDDGDADLDFVAVKDSAAETATAVASIEDDEYVELAFMWDGISRLYYGVNGTVLGYIVPGDSLPDDEALTVTFTLRNGEAVAKTMSVDYLFVAKER